MANTSNFLDSLLEEDFMKVDASTKYRPPPNTRGGRRGGGPGGPGGDRGDRPNTRPQSAPDSAHQSSGSGNQQDGQKRNSHDNYRGRGGYNNRGARNSGENPVRGRSFVSRDPRPSNEGTPNNQFNNSNSRSQKRHQTPGDPTNNDLMHNTKPPAKAHRGPPIDPSHFQRQNRPNSPNSQTKTPPTPIVPSEKPPITRNEIVMTEGEKMMMQRRPKRDEKNADATPATTTTTTATTTTTTTQEAAPRTSPASTPALTQNECEEMPMRRQNGRSALRKRPVLNPEDALKREMINNLNKLTVENFGRICEIICDIVKGIKTRDHLQLAMGLLLDKCVSEIASNEVYIDLIHVISTVSPHFDEAGNLTGNLTDSSVDAEKMDTAQPEDENIKEQNDERLKQFKDIIGSVCGELANQIPPILELTPEQEKLSPEEQGEALLKARMNVIGIAISITSLMIRKLLRPRFWVNMMKRFLYTPEGWSCPAEHLIGAVCESVKICGLFLDSFTLPNDKSKAEVEATPDAKYFLSAHQYFDQMMIALELKTREDDTPARVKYIIQDILDARNHKWYYKTHREKAKTLAAIREDQKRTNVVGGAHVAAQFGTVEQMGVRANLKNEDYMVYYVSKVGVPSDLLAGAPLANGH